MNELFQPREPIPATPRRAVARRAVGRSLVAGVIGLAAHHVLLFGQRLVDRSILEPAVGLRWLAAFLLIAGLGALARRGVRFGEARSASVVAILVLLLHVGLAVPPAAGSAALAPPSGLLAVLPVAVVFAGLVEWLRLTPGARCEPTRPARPQHRRTQDAPARALWIQPAWAARPPPRSA